MTTVFCMAQKTKKIFSQDLKLEKSRVRFLDFTLFFNIAVEKFGKQIIWPSWSSRRRIILRVSRIPRFWVQILEIW